MSYLADRYHEIMGFRMEALSRYRANVLSIFTGPKSRLCFPEPSLKNSWNVNRRVGPIFFKDRAPITAFVEQVIREREMPTAILEIGPGKGSLARTLRERFGRDISAYYAVDRDASVGGAFSLLPAVDSVPGRIDLIIAAEVIEHMSADEFYSSFLKPSLQKLSPGASFIISTPNPVAPGGIARDFTHVQHYPWYDLYAIFRLAFKNVQVYRVHYVFSYRRLLSLLPRFILCMLMEIEWCDTLVCVATDPRSDCSSDGPT